MTTKTKNGLAAHEAVRQVRDGGATIVVDVRTPVEFATERIDGALHVPLDDLSERAEELRSLCGEGLLLCRSGARAEQARSKLEQLGLEGFRVVEGGLAAYVAAGGDTCKTQGAISLERQVRITAGALVVVGVALGFLVHPGLFGLAGFVGAGLVFAGITDTCGMGLMLAKMPWNRVDASG